MQQSSTSHTTTTNTTAGAAAKRGSSIRRASGSSPHIKLEGKLKTLLKKHFGSTKHKEVKQAIDELTPHNPTAEPTKSPLLVGDFICHTIPEFPGRIKTQNKEIIQYTLGRLSFGVFQPHSLVCTIRSVRQSIRVRIATKTGKFKMYEYPVMMDLTVHTPNGEDLPAVVSHDAICYECPKQPHRMKVTFKGSTLMPSREVLMNEELMNVWMETFEGAYEKAALERNILSRTLRSMMAWWFQMTLPSDEEMQNTQDHSVHFEMKRAPKGHLDILYLSDTTRITKGNRGTLVVVEPVDCTIEEGEATTGRDELVPALVGEEPLAVLTEVEA
ncbi:PAP_fibrillin [Seminavis robusta]|uniref:PAP_fibrillin n=1 Tax=Seminavis robusta TaxID=568900 RepID=A0A9N8HVB4_9STRA|nr:PAP_fibrillin [Seminavis robusta]|eukprot:Sro1914_g305060.1 PAP_fibrillin (329) ;mRNA; f:8378-9364